MDHTVLQLLLLTPLSSGFQIICSRSKTGSANPSGCLPCYYGAKWLKLKIMVMIEFTLQTLHDKIQSNSLDGTEIPAIQTRDEMIDKILNL